MVVTSLRTTFAEPFGPWRDHEALHHNLQTVKGRVLILNDFALTRGVGYVGLDATDLLPLDPDTGYVEEVSPQNVEPVFFRAVLSIENPFGRLFDKRGARKNLLTDAGWELLVRQWRERSNGERWKDAHLQVADVLQIIIVGQVSNSVRYLEGIRVINFCTTPHLDV
jgi:hypothetical protein